ncbi:hypothetical protein [Sphingomonas sp. BE138]|nr:hypothetical protein [Sphingomonas sp. BE138]
MIAATPAEAQDRDNNPPGPRGGPGTNWENPRGPSGGLGASPDRRRFVIRGRPVVFVLRPGGYYYHAGHGYWHPPLGLVEPGAPLLARPRRQPAWPPWRTRDELGESARLARRTRSLARSLWKVPLMRMKIPLIFSSVMALATPAAAAPQGVDLATFQAAARTRLLQADTNGDGRLAKAEWTARRQAAGAEVKGDPAKMFDRIDANRDGALDTAELDALLARRFVRMDADKDGLLTADERRAVRGRVGD